MALLATGDRAKTWKQQILLQEMMFQKTVVLGVHQNVLKIYWVVQSKQIASWALNSIRVLHPQKRLVLGCLVAMMSRKGDNCLSSCLQPPSSRKWVR